MIILEIQLYIRLLLLTIYAKKKACGVDNILNEILTSDTFFSIYFMYVSTTVYCLNYGLKQLFIIFLKIDQMYVWSSKTIKG